MDKRDNQKKNKYTPEKTVPRNTVESFTVTTMITVLLMILSEFAVKTYARRSAYAHMENAIFLQHFVDGVIEDLLDLTESEDSSSSSDTGVFESHQPFVLELHDLVKDDPTAPENPAPDAKVKKHRKKKGQLGASQNPTSDTSSSVSESSVPPAALEEHSREEFYDAHESYHGLTENQAAAANPVTAAGLVQARSEHGATPKPTAEQTALPTTPGSGSRREPSTTVTKPTTNPH